ncbi:pentapeptide repeat-containing protein [Helicobacter sp. faydin-H17]|nr:pentapeptide repeat-containing protein [Helicobacter kayseriensis]MCE3047552.1 pentapeptide repeat-containing protein [Helicobacter kayseriensis]
MQTEKLSIIKSIGDTQREGLKNKRNSIILTIEIVQFESPTPLPILINYYTSPSSHPFDEELRHSIYLDYLCTEKIYKHIEKFDDNFDFLIITKENLYLGLNSYNFWTSIHFRGIVSKTIPSDLDTNAVKEYHHAFYSSFFGTNACNQSIDFNTFFQNKVEISGNFIKALDFKNSYFDREVWLRYLLVRKSIGFANCRFNKDFTISAMTLESKTFLDFSHSIFFQKADFSSTQFFGAIRFHRSSFMAEALFYNSQFLDTVNFYFATFMQPPSFSMCVFKDSKLVHFTGVDISHLTLQVLKTNIQEKAQEERGEENDFQGRGTTYLQIQHTINLRDSFRVIKETLNAQSNSLESQKWHKLELYAKELELKYRRKIKNLEKEAREFDQIAKQDMINNERANKKQELYIPRIKQNDSAQMLEINKRESLKNTIEYIQLWFYRHTSDHHTDLLKIISWVIVVIGCFGILLFACRYGTNLQAFINNHSKNTFVALFNTPLITQSKMIGLVYLLGVCSLFWKWSRILFFSSITLSMTLISSKSIFGVSSLLASSASYNPLENFLLLLYALVMILLLFSLQKTARKNSIVPS